MGTGPCKLKYNREHQEIATINVEGKAFKVHKALLVKDSDYFERALNGPFIEGQTQTIDLGADDLHEHFGIYVDVLYHSHFNEKYAFRPEREPDSPMHQILWLWRMSDRFLNKHLLKIAEDSFSWCIDKYTTLCWETYYESPSFTDDKLFESLRDLQDAERFCVRYNLPQEVAIVSAAANAPKQLLGKHHDELHAEFRTKVMKAVLKSVENPLLRRPTSQDNDGRMSVLTHKNKNKKALIKRKRPSRLLFEHDGSVVSRV